MDNPPSEILTIDETAELLKIPRSSVYRLAQQGKIPAKKVGRHWRFHRGVLLRFVAGEPESNSMKADLKSAVLMGTKETNE